jgi:predicted phage terminase large subunit-like protein
LHPEDQQRVVDAALRRHLSAFIQRSFAEVVPGSPFVHNWHLDAMAYALEQVATGDILRLVITVPPRHLKSLSASVGFVAWLLGQDPTRRIITVSYGEDLAAKHALDCRRIMESAWYRRVFPHTRLSKTKNTEGEYVTTQGGYRYSTSVGGAITGRGGTLMILDDPLKPADGLSEPRRTAVNDFFDNTLYSRIDNKGTDPIILVMQRIHEDDLVAHVMAQEPWVQLNLPAIATADEDIPVGPDKVYRRRAGEPLQVERESLEVLARTRRILGSYQFSAQYQQEPIPPGGGLLKWHWFRRYERAPGRRPGDYVLQSWDTACVPGETNDYSVCITALIRGQDVYLLKIYRVRVEYPDLRKLVLEKMTLTGPDEVIIEAADAGRQLVQELRRMDLPGRPRLQCCVPKDSKVVRMAAQSAKLEAGRVYIPRDGDWLADFQREVLQFPKGKHDDQIDALSQLLYRLDCGALWHRQRGFDPPEEPDDPPPRRLRAGLNLG